MALTLQSAVHCLAVNPSATKQMDSRSPEMPEGIERRSKFIPYVYTYRTLYT
jgi:hypothetical protein